MEGRLPAGCGSGGFVLSPGGRKDRSRPPCKRVILNRRDLIEEARTQQSDHVRAAVADDAALAAAHSSSGRRISDQRPYTKVTSADELVSGEYVMVANNGYAPGVLDDTWVTAVAVTAANDQVIDPTGGVWTLTVDKRYHSPATPTARPLLPRAATTMALKAAATGGPWISMPPTRPLPSPDRAMTRSSWPATPPPRTSSVLTKMKPLPSLPAATPATSPSISWAAAGAGSWPPPGHRLRRCEGGRHRGLCLQDGGCHPAVQGG